MALPLSLSSSLLHHHLTHQQAAEDAEAPPMSFGYYVGGNKVRRVEMRRSSK